MAGKHAGAHRIVAGRSLSAAADDAAPQKGNKFELKAQQCIDTAVRFKTCIEVPYSFTRQTLVIIISDISSSIGGRCSCVGENAVAFRENTKCSESSSSVRVRDIGRVASALQHALTIEILCFALLRSKLLSSPGGHFLQHLPVAVLVRCHLC